MSGQGLANVDPADALVSELSDDPLSADEQAALDEYEAALDHAITNGTGTEISNGSPFHARLILTRLFRLADKTVEIYSGHLRQKGPDGNGRIGLIWTYAPLVIAARDFLRKPGTKLSILVQNRLDSRADLHGRDHPFIRTLFEDSQRQGKLELIIARAHETRSIPGGLKHFAVADDRIYRLETRNHGVWATASFKGPLMVRLLKGYFYQLIRGLDLKESICSLSACRFTPEEFASEGRAFALPEQFVGAPINPA